MFLMLRCIQNDCSRQEENKFMLIDRISQMIEMKEIQNKYGDIHGTPPYNVSSWLTSPSYSQEMLTNMKMPEIDNIEYIYTYSMDKQILNDVKRKLAPNVGDECGITFVDNGTQAIMTLGNMIKHNNYKKICIINPAYFSVAQAFRAFDIKYDCVNLQRIGEQYLLPYDELIAARYDVVWLTSPIFSTSVYYDQNAEEMIHKIMEMGTLVISDECFCVSGNELIHRVKNSENFIGIYSPHKSLCINTYKFSALIYPSRFDTFIEHWVDVLTGNLPASAISAVSHFLTPNYDVCLNVYREFMLAARNDVQAILHSKDDIIVDEILIGSLLTLYFKNLTYEQSRSLPFLENVIFNTGTAFYPSFLNGLDETFGFAFRINLALCDKAFLAALDCLVGHLSAYK